MSLRHWFLVFNLHKKSIVSRRTRLMWRLHGPPRPFLVNSIKYLICTSIISFTYPKWIVYEVVSYRHRFVNSHNWELFVTGPLLRDIMENIQDLMSQSSKGRKAKIYSGVNFSKRKNIFPDFRWVLQHGVNISAVLAFHGIKYPHKPVHAGALFLKSVSAK